MTLWITTNEYLFLSAASGYQPEDGADYWHRRRFSTPQPLDRVSPAERAAPQRVQVETDPVPQEAEPTQERRRLCEYMFSLLCPVPVLSAVHQQNVADLTTRVRDQLQGRSTGEESTVQMPEANKCWLV